MQTIKNGRHGPLTKGLTFLMVLKAGSTSQNILILRFDVERSLRILSKTQIKTSYGHAHDMKLCRGIKNSFLEKIPEKHKTKECFVFRCYSLLIRN